MTFHHRLAGAESVYAFMLGSPSFFTRDDVRRGFRAVLDMEIERLIAIADRIDGDPDLETEGDDEPSLGFHENGRGYPSAFGTVATDDREAEDEHREEDGTAEPIVTNATNAEEWWKSRIYWGLIIAGFATVAKPIIGELPITTEQAGDIANALATAGQAVGIAYAWYGRWKGRKLKPLGEATGTGAASL